MNEYRRRPLYSRLAPQKFFSFGFLNPKETFHIKRWNFLSLNVTSFSQPCVFPDVVRQSVTRIHHVVQLRRRWKRIYARSRPGRDLNFSQREEFKLVNMKCTTTDVFTRQTLLPLYVVSNFVKSFFTWCHNHHFGWSGIQDDINKQISNIVLFLSTNMAT